MHSNTNASPQILRFPLCNTSDSIKCIHHTQLTWNKQASIIQCYLIPPHLFLYYLLNKHSPSSLSQSNRKLTTLITMEAETTMSFYSDKYRAEKERTERDICPSWMCIHAFWYFHWLNYWNQWKSMKRKTTLLFYWTSEFQTQIIHHRWLIHQHESSLIQKPWLFIRHW